MSIRCTTRTQFATRLTIAAVVPAIVLAGCSKNTESSDVSTDSNYFSVSKDDSIAALVPEAVRTSGNVNVGVNIPYKPNEYKDSSGKIVGFDVDLMNAVTGVLGVKPSYRESDFSTIIPSIQAGTYDLGMSSFTIDAERIKSVDFASYYSAGILWAQPKGKSVDPNNACGLKVAVQSTTVEDTDDVPGKSAACEAAGKPAIDKLKYDSQDEAANALALGKVDAMSADSPVTSAAIKALSDKIEAAGQPFDIAPYGWAVAKGSALGPALQKAVQKLIDDGTYLKICKHWGVESGAITTSQINPT